MGASAFVKPLTGSRGDFAQAVHGEAALVRYLDEVAKYYDAVLIQPIVEGVEYRIFLLDDEALLLRAQISALRAAAMACEHLRDLLSAHNDAPARPRPFAGIACGCDDPSLDAVLAKGERRDIPGRMNLSAGGTMVLEAAPSRKAVTLAQAAARALGLRVAAVDLFVDIGGEAVTRSGSSKSIPTRRSACWSNPIAAT